MTNAATVVIRNSDILVQFLFQLLTGYGTDYACKELSADAYFPQNYWKEGSLLHSQPYPVFFPELTRKQSIVCDASTLNWSNSFYSFTS
ncbi:hypothetical protein SPAP_1367 [Streptococcus pneumoniae AP200]|nr:hypothetical protein SPAP_1367 [Streptococcus pneumoniae AP200]